MLQNLATVNKENRSSLKYEQTEYHNVGTVQDLIEFRCFKFAFQVLLHYY